MSKTLRLLLALLVATVTLSPVFAADAPAPRTLTGTYIWEQANEAGDLKAVFTPAEEGHWKVDFHFVFQGQAHVYSGTADGKLDQGALSGRVETDQGRGVFTFQGEFKDGKFTGSHARLSAGNEERTGTLVLGG